MTVLSNTDPAMKSANTLFPCFARADLAFGYGSGSWLCSTDGRRFLDFATGIAVTGLGHSHPQLIAALTRQAQNVWHISNAYRIPEQERLADRLCAATFADRVFFNNSGAEALETAIKTARRYQFSRGHPERYRLLTFEGAFHGRTLGTIAAGGQAKYLEGFGPPLDGFDSIAFGDVAALEAACGPQTAGILIEPIQGESGVRSLSPDTLRRIRALCDEKQILLLFDEVQTGIGRTGELFAYQASGVIPDILASAKGLGNGFPVAACLATEAAAAGMIPGTHGSTFGGNPLAMVVAGQVLEIVMSFGFLERVRERGERLGAGLSALVAAHPAVFQAVRGEGLLRGLKCGPPVAAVASTVRDHELLTVTAGDNVLRILPPLTVSEEEIDEGLLRLSKAALALEAASS